MRREASQPDRGARPAPLRGAAVVALCALLALADGATADPVDDLVGRWCGEALLDSGDRALATIEVWRDPSGSARLEVQGELHLPNGGASTRWAGSGRLEGDDLHVALGAGAIHALPGAASGGALEGRWTLRSDGVLAGGWRDAAGLPRSREELSRRAACPAPVVSQDVLVWAPGEFLTGPEACPQLNANDPEVITDLGDGRVIGVSTLAPAGRSYPEAHLDHRFNGRFRVFTSNQNRTGATIHQVLALHAPGDAPVRVRVRHLTSASTREAPYRDWHLPDEVVARDDAGGATSGPGDRAASAALRGWREGPAELVVGSGRVVALLVRPLAPGEERMTHAELEADGELEAAVLYLPQAPQGDAVEHALLTGRLLLRSGHDREPTPLDAPGPQIFGRVAGVAAASTWAGRLTTDGRGEELLTVPGVWRFGWNAIRGEARERMSAPLLARNPHSAWRAWGSYAVEHRLALPLSNPLGQPARVRVYLESLANPAQARAFRGTFELTWAGERRFVHVIQRSGCRGTTPLFERVLEPAERLELVLRTVYSANNQAPAALRVEVAPTP